MLCRGVYRHRSFLNVKSKPLAGWHASAVHLQLLPWALSPPWSYQPRPFSSSSIFQSTSDGCPPEPKSESKRPGDGHGSILTQFPPLASLLSPANHLHSSLSTFLDHAHRVKLKPSTQVFVGTRYEYLTQETLARYGFELQRTGKTGDRGVDLVGWWHLPEASHASEPRETNRLRVLVQCKRLKGKKGLTPAAVRELEGAFLGAPAGWRSDEVLGVMVSTRPATKGVITALTASKKGLVWVCLEELDKHQPQSESEEEQATYDAQIAGRADDADGDLEVDAEDSDISRTTHEVSGRAIQLLYNQAARRLGLEGLDVIRRHSLDESDQSEHDEVMLVYRGRPMQSPQP